MDRSKYKNRVLQRKFKTIRTNYESQSGDVEEIIELSDDMDIDTNSEPDVCQPVLESFEFDDNSLQLEIDSDGDDSYVFQSDTDNSDFDNSDESDYSADSDDCYVGDNVDETVVLIILEFYLRHNLTWTALDDLLSLINRIQKMGKAVVPRSKYLFQKILPKTEAPIYHYYCKKCTSYVGEEKQLIKELHAANKLSAKVKTKLVKCGNCQYEFNLKSKTEAAFFVQLKLKPQLENIVRKFKDNFTTGTKTNDNTSYDDVTCGKYYKSVKQKIPDLLSLTFNTDGVKIFNSRKKSSLWPLLMVVNEVPKEHRFKRENMVVGGLWYGNDPDFNMYLKPLIDDLTDINKEKFCVRIDNIELRFTVCAIIFCADSPAKAKVLNCMLYSGSYGCPYCFHEGDNSDGTMRYPHMKEVRKRTHELVVGDALKAIQNRAKGLKCDDIRGVKGPSSLLLLPQFNIVDGVPVDYMHAALHGITAKLEGLWFDTENHHEHFYIGRPNQLKIIDKSISTIRPPKSLTRYPRSITDRGFYKASEHLNWLLYYGAACIDNMLPDVYVKHFQLFSSSIFTLNKDKISQSELKDAENNLKQFAEDFPRLYGKQNEVFNEHLVSHISDSVQNCGPLWAYSNFPFEDMNGVLKSYVNGTSDVLKQIVTKFLLNEKLREKLGNVNVKDRYRKNSQKVGDIILFGKAQLPSKVIKKEMFTIISSNDDYKNFRIYRSCSIRSNYIKGFEDKIKCDDSIIKTIKGEYHRVYHIYKVNEKVFFCTKKIEISKRNSALYVEHLRTILSESIFQSLAATEFSEKCFHIKTNQHNLLSTFPNNVERY